MTDVAIKIKDADKTAKVNGFKSIASMELCREAMKEQGISISINRHNFIKGWQAHEKVLKEKNNG